MSITQRLAVSALLVANESLIESGRLSAEESELLRKVIASVKDAFEHTPSVPTLIVADPDYDATFERISEVMEDVPCVTSLP